MADDKRGFTIVELISIIVILGVIVGIAFFAYNDTQIRARNADRLSDITIANQLIRDYLAKNHEYPKTTNNPQSNWKAADVRTDDNCMNGSSQSDWIPGVGTLPQSDQTGVGVDDIKGCYLYVSDGVEYVISAWNMISPPQNEALYRRLGFREFQTASSTQFYTCNSNPVGGATGGYDINDDYYKHSYTVSNITNCNETPPPGA